MEDIQIEPQVPSHHVKHSHKGTWILGALFLISFVGLIFVLMLLIRQNDDLDLLKLNEKSLIKQLDDKNSEIDVLNSYLTEFETRYGQPQDYHAFLPNQVGFHYDHDWHIAEAQNGDVFVNWVPLDFSNDLYTMKISVEKKSEESIGSVTEITAINLMSEVSEIVNPVRENRDIDGHSVIMINGETLLSNQDFSGQKRSVLLYETSSSVVRIDFVDTDIENLAEEGWKLMLDTLDLSKIE